jgi:5'-3' exonuclease
MQIKTLLLVDVSHIFRAAWHASADQDLNTAYSTTVQTVRRISSGFDYVAICCDHPPYFRKQIHREYKANRDTPEPSMIEQFRRTKERLRADGGVLWSVQGYEADDIIAGAVRWATQIDEFPDLLTVTIASNDKDLLQLVRDGVSMLSTKDGKRYDSAAVQEKFGIPPTLIRDMLALAGDTSDNVPGVPRVGPKTAAGLLREWNSLEAIMIGAEREPERFKPALLAAMKESRDLLKVSLSLVTLKTDAPVDYESVFDPPKPTRMIEDAEYEDIDKEEDEMQDAENEGGAETAETTEQPQPEAKSQPEQERPAAMDDPRANTQIVKVAPQQWSLALEPSSAGSAWKIAKALSESRLYTSFPNAEAIFAVILRGRALGLDATTALANFHIVEGRPTMSAALIVGLVLNSGKAEFFDLVESTREKATWETARKGRKPIRMTYDLQDADDAGLLRPSRSGKPTNWQTRPKTMLRWRAATELARAVFPDITAGLYTPDEISDGAIDVAEPQAAE